MPIRKGAGWLVAGCLSVAAGSSWAQDQTKEAATRHITAQTVKPLIVELADDKYEGRGAGYHGEQRAGDYIAKAFAKVGLQAAGDTSRGKRTYFQSFAFYPHDPGKPWEQLKSRNVLGFLEGSDPELKKQIVVIGAHYDGQGRAGQADPFRRPASDSKDAADEIWNSANDNVTSVSAVVAIARAIKDGGALPKRSILFAAFGAEEHGMAGSIHYVSHPAFELSQHVAMINLEKLGRSPEQPIGLNAMMTGRHWAELLKTTNEQMGMKVLPNIPVPIPDSDHYPFASSRIPAVMLAVLSGVDAHQPTDTADKIDFERTAEAARFAYAMLVNLANRAERPTFSQSILPDPGMVADLASPKECDALRLGPEEGCLRVTGVIPGRPAEKAGLKVGDAILQIADRVFRRNETLAELQKGHEDVLRGKYGKAVRAKVLRGGQRLEIVIPITTQ